jgi:hypothetical protein
LAIIQLKNGIEKYWRLFSHVKNGLSPEEKALIRTRLFQGTIEEEEKSLALHNSLATAKIVRIDYPQEWPEALTSIIGILRASKAGNQQHLYGGLQILLRVVKELGSARLRRSQTALQSVAPEIVYLLCEIYSEKTAIWVEFLANARGDEGDADFAMLNSLFALKILRRLLIVGFEQPHHDKTVQQFWSLSQNHFGQFLNFVSLDSVVPALYQDTVGKHLLQFTKMHLDMADGHPASFVMLPNSLPLVHAYWDLVAKFAEVFENSGGIKSTVTVVSSEYKSKMEGPLLERLALKGLLLLRACRRIASTPKQTFKYRSATAKAEQDEACNIMKTELFKGDFVIQIVKIIINHLLSFRKADLEAWEDDPEEWEQQEQSEGNAYEWEVKPCAERLFLDMVTDHKELLVPPLLAYFQSATIPEADIAVKEAVYTALGIAAAHVVNVFDFDAFVASTLAQDAQQQGPLVKVLRRRIAILLASWAPVKMNDQTRSFGYEIFKHFVNHTDPDNDIVVRITAARQLKWLLDDLDFNAEAFLPHTSDIIKELVSLIQYVSVDEAELAVLETLRLLVTRMEAHIAKFGDYIMAALPEVWDSTGPEEYMMKQGVIAILSALVMSMEKEHQKYQQFFLIPLIAEAARPGSDMHVHLMDESLELWNNILIQTSPPLIPDLINLAELALPLLEYQAMTAEQALSVVESYILLAPEACIADKLRRPLVGALSGVLDSSSRGMVRSGTVCLEYLIRVAEGAGGSNGISVVMQDMLETGLLRKIMGNIHDSWEANETTGPNRKMSKVSQATEQDYFAILSRLALADPALFFQMMTSFGTLEDVWKWLGRQWFVRVDYMDDPPREKLSLLGMTRLLEVEPMQGLVLAWLQDFIAMWTNTILELQDGIVDGTDSLIHPDLEPTEYDTPKSIKEREVMQKDPVHTVNALEFVKVRLQHIVARAGGEQVFESEWAVNVDRDVIQKFWDLMRG